MFGLTRCPVWVTPFTASRTNPAQTYAQSGGGVTQESVELHADDAAALIRALGLAPVILVGSSGGARIGLDVLRRYPDLVPRRGAF